MNYIGSKHSLLSFLENSIKEVVNSDLSSKTICDIFAGTGAVGEHFRKLGCRVIANDLMYYSYVLNRHKIGNSKEMSFGGLDFIKSVKASEKAETVRQYLNNLEEVTGFIYNNYSPNDVGERMYFTRENAKKCDAIRQKIGEWLKSNQITENEYYYLLASLLKSIDKRANTASVYGAYLKEYKKSALKPFELELLPVHLDNNGHKVYNKDANELVKDLECDILYLDPPYNARQYSSNYHVLETIAKYDNPELSGKSGLRIENKKSKYCSKSAVKEEFADLIEKTKAKYIFLSYNNEGLMSLGDIKNIMQNKGQYGVLKTEYSRYKADNAREHKASSTIEFLHYVRAR